MNRSIKYMLLSAALLPLATHAIEGKDIAKCAADTNAVTRLECYDKIAKNNSLVAETTTTTPQDAGDWQTNSKTDPLTDDSIEMALLPASSGKGRFGETIVLVVRCANNKTEMYINWQSFLGTDSTSITYRIDKAKARTIKWDVSTDHKAAFYPNSPIPVLKELAESTSFVANVTPYSDNPITAVFNTTGANEALQKIRQNCNW